MTVLILLLLAACTPLEEKPNLLQEPEDRAKVDAVHSLVQPARERFFKRLRQREGKGVSTKDLLECRLDELEDDDIKVGRTSHKLRNPGNKPAPWMEPHLRAFAGKKKGETPPYIIEKLGDGKIGYLEPLFMEPVCLDCHGNNLAPALVETVDERFPDDEAVGFEDGEFRGFIWVETMKPKPAPSKEIKTDAEALEILVKECRECHQQNRHRGARFLRREGLTQPETISRLIQVIESGKMPKKHADFKNSEDGKAVLRWLRSLK